MKKNIALFSLLFFGISYSMEKDQTKQAICNEEAKDNAFIVDEYGSETTTCRRGVIEKAPLNSDEKPRVIWVKGRMKMPRPVTLPSVANQRQKLLLEQAAKLRANL